MEYKGLIQDLPSRKLTWKPKKGPKKTTVLLNGGYMGFHVSLGECTVCKSSNKLVASSFVDLNDDAY